MQTCSFTFIAYTLQTMRAREDSPFPRAFGAGSPPRDQRCEHPACKDNTTTYTVMELVFHKQDFHPDYFADCSMIEHSLTSPSPSNKESTIGEFN